MITAADITAALRELGVGPADVLYAHSGMQSAIRAEGSTREEKMDTVLDGLQDVVGGGVLMLPTYSYSYTRGEDFDVAFSPERIDPGNTTFGLRNTPKIVGGVTDAATERAAASCPRAREEKLQSCASRASATIRRSKPRTG